MDQKMKESVRKGVRQFSLPSYHEIPNVGLYLEQTAKYITEYLEPLQDVSITTSMISNYVKKGLVSNPVKKQYSREQIAYLIFIAVAKTVISMENIGQILQMQKETCSAEYAYDYFRKEMETTLQAVFGSGELPEVPVSERMEKKLLLRNLIITVAHKVYLDACFAEMRKTEEPEDKD